MAKVLNVITVCGSGTISSSFVAAKIKEELSKEGFEVHCTEVTNGQVAALVSTGNYDMICAASPVREKYDIPVISCVGLLTGFGEEECIEEVIEAAKNTVK